MRRIGTLIDKAAHDISCHADDGHDDSVYVVIGPAKNLHRVGGHAGTWRRNVYPNSLADWIVTRPQRLRPARR